jgi:glycerol-3-phosphate dehydrogenase
MAPRRATCWAARARADLGRDFGATLTEAEVRWLMAREYARTAEDVSGGARSWGCG